MKMIFFNNWNTGGHFTTTGYGICTTFGPKVVHFLPWIPEPSVNNKLKRREGSGSTGRFFD
jgi:hypothetical protein